MSGHPGEQLVHGHYHVTPSFQVLQGFIHGLLVGMVLCDLLHMDELVLHLQPTFNQDNVLLFVILELAPGACCSPCSADSKHEIHIFQIFLESL